jgi:serine/threonine protein kinase
MRISSPPLDRADLARTCPVSGPATIESARLDASRTRDHALEFSLDRVAIGDLLGKYELVAEIARGSTSRVFLGRHTRLRFDVAIKLLEPRLLLDYPEAARQLEAEAILLAKLNHPNIVRLWDLDDWEVPYLVIEYVAGGSLAQLIGLHGALPVPFAWAIVRQAVEGLAEAHRLGIIHRDVKPGNLLITEEGVVKVADLGLALTRDSRRETSSANEGTISGTVAFVSPEQARRPDDCDARSDIYSLGASLFQAVTGRYAFEGKSVSDVLMKRLTRPAPDPREFVPEIPEACAAVIRRMLEKEPDDRYATYDELRLALGSAIGDRRAPRPLAEAFLRFGR